MLGCGHDMNLYGQEAEAGLLASFIPHLAHRSVIDVGAERGAFAEELLRAGSDAVHVIEPEPGNLTYLRERFRDDQRVTVHGCAASDRDGRLELHVSEGPDGAPVTFGHTVLDRPNTDEIAWRETITVDARSLASLVETGEVPGRVGIVKVDTEGNDLAVVAGMGTALDCDVVMVEHWDDLPQSLGPCPWSSGAMISALRTLGFSHFAFIVHREELTILQWDDAAVPVEYMGNLVFVHDRMLQELLPKILECASSLAEGAAEVAEARRSAADERLVVIEELTHARDLEAKAAAERLAVIEELRRERDSHAKAEDRLATIARGSAARRTRVTRVRERVRSWTKPRIGNLRHYEPKRLTVPAHYLRKPPPDPAPSISIVTPSYQQGTFLERTLYSVISQNYPTLEYVVQDGASSDDTLEVLRRFEPALTRWTSEEDGGQADAINRGFRHTTGEIMAWLNSDDLLLPGALTYVASYFSQHPDVDVVYGHRLMIDADDGQIGAWVLPPHDDLALTLADFVPQETLFWRRHIWEAVGSSVDSTFAYALDWDLLLRFRDAGARMVRLPRFIGAFRIHDEQKTTFTHAVGEAECDLLRQRVHGRTVPHTEVLKQLRPYLLRHTLAHTRQRIVDRLPAQRVQVRTVPLEPWLMAPETGPSIPERASSENGEVTPVSPLAS
jgi:FkbM family methyltransferase